jgi:hypothetical protein
MQYRSARTWRSYSSLALCGLVLMVMATAARSQSLEPRAYSNSPVGLNFLVAGYAHTEGKIAFDPTLPIVDAKFDAQTGVLAYARSLDVWGESAKFDVVLPVSSFTGNALVSGQSRQRDVSGFNDPRFRFSVNFYGAPALSVEEFAGYQQDVIVGASVQVSPPLGQYDDSKLINLGDNRWSFKPELGISKAWGPWIAEIAPNATFYTDNSDFNEGNRFAREALYAVEAHLIYTFTPGMWLSLDGTYFSGNRTSLNGVPADNRQENTRAGATFALPVDRSNSLKFYVSGGTSTRTGAYFNAVGLAWQYRWGGGF